MANESNDKNFKNKLTEDLKKKIQESVRNSFDKNIGGKGGTENSRIRDFEKSAVDEKNRYEDIKRNTGGGFAGGVAGKEKMENSRIRDSRKNAAGNSQKSPKEKRDRYEGIRKNAMGGIAGGAAERNKFQSPVIRQAEIRRIKEDIKKSKENIGKQKKKAFEKYSVKAKMAKKKMAQLKKAAAIKAKKSKAPGGLVTVLALITFLLACLVDVVDVIGTLGVELGAVPTAIAYLINLISSIIITITWQIIFSGSKGKNKKQTKMIIRSILILFGLENVPIVELAPFNAIAVILNYIDFIKGKKSG